MTNGFKMAFGILLFTLAAGIYLDIELANHPKVVEKIVVKNVPGLERVVIKEIVVNQLKDSSTQGYLVHHATSYINNFASPLTWSRFFGSMSAVLPDKCVGQRHITISENSIDC